MSKLRFSDRFSLGGILPRDVLKEAPLIKISRPEPAAGYRNVIMKGNDRRRQRPQRVCSNFRLEVLGLVREGYGGLGDKRRPRFSLQGFADQDRLQAFRCNRWPVKAFLPEFTELLSKLPPPPYSSLKLFYWI